MIRRPPSGGLFLQNRFKKEECTVLVVTVRVIQYRSWPESGQGPLAVPLRQSRKKNIGGY